MTSMGRNGVHARFQNYEMDEFITRSLSNFIGQATGETGFHVVNKTGLAGKYDFTLKFDMNDGKIVVPRGRANTPPEMTSPAESASDPSGPTQTFQGSGTATRIATSKGEGVPLDVIVIDHLETVPIEN